MSEVYSAIPLGPNFRASSSSSSTGRTNSFLDRLRGNDRHGYYRVAVTLGTLILSVVIISTIVHFASSSSSFYYLNNGHVDGQIGENYVALADYSEHPHAVQVVPSSSSALRGSVGENNNNNNSNSNSNTNSRQLDAPSTYTEQTKGEVVPKQEVQPKEQQLKLQLQQSPILVVREQHHETHYLPQHGMQIQRSTLSTTMTQSSSSSISSSSSSLTSFSTSSSFVQVVSTTSTLHRVGDEGRVGASAATAVEETLDEDSGSYDDFDYNLDYLDSEVDADFDGEEEEEKEEEEAVEETIDLNEPAGYQYSDEEMYASVHDSLTEKVLEEGSIDRYDALDEQVERKDERKEVKEVEEGKTSEEIVDHEKIVDLLPSRMETIRVE